MLRFYFHVLQCHLSDRVIMDGKCSTLKFMSADPVCIHLASQKHFVLIVIDLLAAIQVAFFLFGGGLTLLFEVHIGRRRSSNIYHV
jgi:hypothetical protein